MLTYSKRRNIFEKTRWKWRVSEDSISVCDHKGSERACKWSDIAAIRLGYSPTEYKPWRYILVLRFKSGEVWKIDNSSFAGIGDYANQSREFSAFARAVTVKAAARAPTASVRVGEGPAFYWLMIAVFVVLAVLIGGLLAITAPIPGPAFVKGALILFFLPAAVLWARKAYPRRVPIGAIPDDAFPPLKDAA